MSGLADDDLSARGAADRLPDSGRRRRANLTLRQVIRQAPRELTNESGQLAEETMRAVDADLRRIGATPVRSFSAGSVLGVLLADANARSILGEHLPDLMNSLWLSQAMGFPLTRVHEVVPMEIPAQELRAVDQALRRIGR